LAKIPAPDGTMFGGLTMLVRQIRIAALFLLAAPLAHADTTSLAGRWTATPMASNWVIGDWGPACGPKPSGGGEPGGVATVAESGSELVISGVGRTYRTTECWEQFPGLGRTGHSASARSWRTSCQSPKGDARQAKLITTVTATDALLTFDETGQYQFVIQGQNCTASVRRTRYFRPLRETPASPASAAGSAGRSATAGKSPRETACASVGPAARIELRPSRKLIQPGQSFTFQAAVVDAKGCSVSVTPTFRLEGDVNGVTLSGGAAVHVADDAPEGDARLVASVGGRSVSAALNIVSKSRFSALLAGGGFDETGASAEAAVARLETGSVGARSAVIEDESGRRRTVFVGVVGGAALLLGLFGFVLARRNRRAEKAGPPPSRPRAADATPRPPMVCPTCRDEYPPEAQFCAVDGNRLVPLEPTRGPVPTGAVCPVCGQGFDPGVSACPKHDEPLVPPSVFASRTLAAPRETRKICPVCGAQYLGEGQFCGQCGAALVPVN